MPSPFDGLASVFTGALGQTVTITPAGGSATEITAIFVNRSEDDIGVILRQPAIHASSDDIAGLGDGDPVVVGADTFVAREFRPDGRGMTTVILERTNG